MPVQAVKVLMSTKGSFELLPPPATLAAGLLTPPANLAAELLAPTAVAAGGGGRSCSGPLQTSLKQLCPTSLAVLLLSPSCRSSGGCWRGCCLILHVRLLPLLPACLAHDHPWPRSSLAGWPRASHHTYQRPRARHCPGPHDGHHVQMLMMC